MASDNLHQSLTAAFRFGVSLDGSAVAAFTECSLPTIELEVEQLKEGGLNSYVHQLPGMRKPSKITLNNGIGVIADLQEWLVKTMGGEIIRKQVSVSLLNDKLDTILTLNMENAFPTKWTAQPLKSDGNTVAIQTMELACGEISFD